MQQSAEDKWHIAGLGLLLHACDYSLEVGHIIAALDDIQKDFLDAGYSNSPVLTVAGSKVICRLAGSMKGSFEPLICFHLHMGSGKLLTELMLHYIHLRHE